jgi:hypothetical protein
VQALPLKCKSKKRKTDDFTISQLLASEENKTCEGLEWLSANRSGIISFTATSVQPCTFLLGAYCRHFVWTANQKKKTEDFTISQPLASEEKKTREEGFEMISEQIRHHIFHSFCCMLQQDMLSSPQHHPMWLELCPTTRRGSASPGQFCSTKSVGLAHRQGLCCPGYTCITCMSRLWLYVWLRPESLAWPSSFHLRAVRAFSQP